MCPSRGCPLHLHRRPHEHYSTYVGGFCYSVLSSRFRRRHLTSHLKNHWVANITERFSLPPAELTGPVPCTAASRPAGERVSGVPDSRAAQTGRPPRPCPAPPCPALAALLRTLRVPTSTGCPVVGGGGAAPGPGPPGVSSGGAGPRLRGQSGHVIHLENNFLDTPIRSAAVGGMTPNVQLCRYCAAAGHFAWESLRIWSLSTFRCASGLIQFSM